MITLAEAKAACLGASSEALALFDLLEADGEEALFLGDAKSRALGLKNFYEHADALTVFFRTQATLKLLALGGLNLLNGLDELTEKHTSAGA